MNYEDASRYLDSFVDYERKPPDARTSGSMGLVRVRALLEALGSPHERLKCLHIAGTKGKGSTAAMAESVLRAAGYRTGLYTSPHLVHVRERIRVDGDPISPDNFARLVERTRPHLEKVREQIRTLPPGASLRQPTYFEIMTHAAFLYFEEREVDVAVLEVGMGGRLDATNVVTPLAAAITNVSLDHTAILGTTVAEIAREKAGILKARVPAVVAPQRASAARSIRSTARRVGAPLWWVGRQVTYDDHGPTFTVRTPGGGGDRVDNSLDNRLYSGLSVPLWGAHQRENACVAVGLLELARRAGFERITPALVREGLANVNWPGRIQKVADSPVTILDGAHNLASIRALVTTLGERFPEKKHVYVLAVAQDKDWESMIEALAPTAQALVATTSGSPRTVPPGELAESARAAGVGRVEVEEDAPRALEAARGIAGPEGSVVATGSLYLVGLLLAGPGPGVA